MGMNWTETVWCCVCLHLNQNCCNWRASCVDSTKTKKSKKTICVRSWCNWRASCVDSTKKEKKSMWFTLNLCCECVGFRVTLFIGTLWSILQYKLCFLWVRPLESRSLVKKPRDRTLIPQYQFNKTKQHTHSVFSMFCQVPYHSWLPYGIAW